MENAAHLHLLVNHFPIIGGFLAIPLLAMAFFLRKERGLLLAAVFLLVVTAVTGWLSVSTGDKAMDMIENQEGKPWFKVFDSARDAVDEHEERADKAMFVAVPTALLGIVVLLLAHRRAADNPLPRIWIGALFVGAVATGGAMAYVGNAGGGIMHREIRGDSLDTVRDAEPRESREK